MRGIAIRGVTLLFVASLLAKLTGFATLYVTGALLSERDFALYAIAIAWGEIFGFLQNGGLNRLLLQRARSFDNLYAPVLGLSLAINGLWFAIIVALAPFVADVYRAPEVFMLMVFFAISIPVSTMAMQLRAYLQVKMRFAELSVLDVYEAFIRNGGIILLAVAGFGPLSFVLPVIAVGVFETIYLSRRRKGSWRLSLPRRRLFLALAKPALWIMVSMVAAALVVNGDYLVIGALEDKVIVGTYFFGFRLTVAVLTMFTRSLRSVFVPSFVALGDDRARQESAFLRSLESAAFLLFFILFSIAAVAEPVVGWVWSGKWNAAIPVVEIIAVASLARVVSPIGRTLLEARGAWRTVAWMSWIEGLSLMASAAIGAYLGGLFEIAVAVGIQMTLVGVLYILVIYSHTSLSLATLGKSVLGPYALAAIALASAWALAAFWQPLPGPLSETIVKGLGFATGYVLLIALFRRDLIYVAADMVRKRLSR